MYILKPLPRAIKRLRRVFRLPTKRTTARDFGTSLNRTRSVISLYMDPTTVHHSADSHRQTWHRLDECNVRTVAGHILCTVTDVRTNLYGGCDEEVPAL